jgi:hypothetical protein
MDSKKQLEIATLDMYLLQNGRESLTQEQLDKILSKMHNKRLLLRVAGQAMNVVLTGVAGFLVGALLGLEPSRCAVGLVAVRLAWGFNPNGPLNEASGKIAEDTMKEALEASKPMKSIEALRVDNVVKQ